MSCKNSSMMLILNTSDRHHMIAKGMVSVRHVSASMISNGKLSLFRTYIQIYQWVNQISFYPSTCPESCKEEYPAQNVLPQEVPSRLKEDKKIYIEKGADAHILILRVVREGMLAAYKTDPPPPSGFPGLLQKPWITRLSNSAPARVTLL